MRRKPLEDSGEDSFIKRGGRPKGRVSLQTKKMLESWDSITRAQPTLNVEALFERVAEDVFGVRMNPRVRKAEKAKLKRTIQRYRNLSS